MSNTIPDKDLPDSTQASSAGTVDLLKLEQQKCGKIWDELVRVGKSWESQATYIVDLEKERARLNEALRTMYEAYEHSLGDFAHTITSLLEKVHGQENHRSDFIPNRMEIIMAYLLFFDRLPARAEEIENLGKAIHTREDLLEAFLRSDEAKSRYRVAIPYEFTGLEPPMPIEWQVDDKSLRRFYDNTKRIWTQFGETEPHWSVMTDERYRAAAIEGHDDLFFESGKNEIRRFRSTLERNGIEWGKLKSCLDFGCGVGRLTAELSPLFEKVYGADISHFHLKTAETVLTSRGLTNIDWLHISDLDQLEKLPRVDTVVCVIVLQHNPPPISSCILTALLNHLNPGGVAYFQIPTYIKGYSFEPESYLDMSQSSSEMEMHPLEQAAIFRICSDAGTDVLEVHADRWCKGLQGVSSTFLVKKK